MVALSLSSRSCVGTARCVCAAGAAVLGQRVVRNFAGLPHSGTRVMPGSACSLLSLSQPVPFPHFALFPERCALLPVAPSRACFLLECGPIPGAGAVGAGCPGVLRLPRLPPPPARQQGQQSRPSGGPAATRRQCQPCGLAQATSAGRRPRFGAVVCLR